MPALVIIERLDSPVKFPQVAHYVMPGETSCFYTEDTAQSIGQSLLISCDLADQGVEVHDGPRGENYPDPGNQAAVAEMETLYTAEDPLVTMRPGAETTFIMRDYEEGLLDVTVLHTDLYDPEDNDADADPKLRSLVEFLINHPEIRDQSSYN